MLYKTYISDTNSCSSQCYLISEYKICKTFQVWICAGLWVEEPPYFSSNKPANTEENKLEKHIINDINDNTITIKVSPGKPVAHKIFFVSIHLKRNRKHFLETLLLIQTEMHSQN